MPFRVADESFEISRPPSEVFADTVDLFSEEIVNGVMDKVSALLDHESDAVDSNAEETPELEDGEHALQKLHRSVIEAVYAELLQRMRSKNQLTEAVKTQHELLTGSLAVSIVRAIKSVDPKGLYRPGPVPSGSSPSVKEEPLVSSRTVDDVMLPSQDSSRGFMSDRQHLSSLAAWLVVRVLAQSETWVC
ncbi:hypothetical protein AOLI_G00290500 [Acnodon oligacanthus]